MKKNNVSFEHLSALKATRINLKNITVDDISSYSLLQTNINSRECPHCGSHQVISYGNYNNRKRYLCKNCKKTYNDLTKTPFSGIHNKQKILKYLNCMINGISIRKAATIVNVSILTSFNWRHKILKALDKLPSPKMHNVKEIMELEIPYSHKGQRTKLSKFKYQSKLSVIFACDRTGKLDSDCIPLIQREYNPLLRRIKEQCDKHTDILLSTKLFNIFSYTDINLKTFNSNYSKPTIISNIISLWELWMKRFRGVASKYLSHYLHWFDFLDNSLFDSNQTQDLILLLMKHL